MKLVLNKVLVCVALVLMAFPVLPVSSTAAEALPDPAAPVSCAVSDSRLELVWRRSTWTVENVNRFLERSATRIEWARERLQEATANGRDISALDAALDTFANAVEEAKPISGQAEAIIAAHEGFTGEGKVSDCGAAGQTLEHLRDTLHQLRDVLGSPARALRDAIRAFRAAQRPPAESAP